MEFLLVLSWAAVELNWVVCILASCRAAAGQEGGGSGRAPEARMPGRARRRWYSAHRLEGSRITQ